MTDIGYDYTVMNLTCPYCSEYLPQLFQTMFFSRTGEYLDSKSFDTEDRISVYNVCTFCEEFVEIFGRGKKLMKYIDDEMLLIYEMTDTLNQE